MTRDEYLKQQPDEDHNSLVKKLKRAQLHIFALKKENQELKSELRKLDKKYCDALRKLGTYKKQAEVIFNEALSTSGKGGRET